MTPLALLDFDEHTKRVRLKSYHPGHTVAEVVAKTGFELIIPPDVRETESPTQVELGILREIVDRDGVLRRLI
jgi:glutaconate CoA-transferase subunit B